ncbi:MAG: hypothetical protein FJX76_05100 [Armatimonadetes bacterium]|nr:hypothetical protein [Armatimonadota bacterium]
MTNDSPRGPGKALTRAHQTTLAREAEINDWQAMGDAFEGLCKAGLALTVGFSVAAAFCKMMDQKKLDIPQFVNRMAGVMFTPVPPGREKDSEKPH